MVSKRKPFKLRLWQRIRSSRRLAAFCRLFVCPIIKHDWDDGNYEPYPSVCKRCWTPDV